MKGLPTFIKVLLLCFVTAAPAPAQKLASVITIKALPTPNQAGAIPLRAATAQARGSIVPEQWEDFIGYRIVRNVSAPTLTPFLPDPTKASGAAVIVAPGGAFSMLMMDNEGYEVARWLADHGVAAFVLKYRLNATPQDREAFGAQMMALQRRMMNRAPADAESAPSILSTPAFALIDGQTAVALVRSRAREWNIDPRRVGFLGFSAGAALTISVGLANDRTQRPDFIAPIYGPMGHQTVPNDAPPLFAAVAADDGLFGRGNTVIIHDWLAAKRPAELHVYVRGDHGFGMKKQGSTSDHWIEELYWWMTTMGFVKM